MSLQCPKCGGTKMWACGKTDTGKKTRYRCGTCKHRTTNPWAEYKPTLQVLPKSQKYVITSAQNATGVYQPFLNALKTYCKHTGAHLIVVPFRYRNPTSMWTENNEHDDWWDESVLPYLYQSRVNLNARLVLLADIRVQPTADSPLSGFDNLTGAMSGIVAHPKLELRCIPTPHKSLPKVMTTTGACTKRNYTDTKAGKRGEFHHTLGACVVELEGDTFHMRQINAVDNGSFQDLVHEYSADGVKLIGHVSAIVMGDTHVDFVDPDVVQATFVGPGSMLQQLKPKQLVWHDVLDFYSRNHHTKNDPFANIAKRGADRDKVGAEIARAVAFIDKYTPAVVRAVLVPSNHHDALTRWVKETDWRADPVNAQTYLETALDMANSARMGENGTEVNDPFHYWIRKLGRHPKMELLRRDESFRIEGIEVGMHGDMGPNGVRGSMNNLSRIGVKSVIGHSHTPGIREGCYQVGTSSKLRLEYNHGASSWLHTHCLIYPNGKRTLVSIINGRWRISKKPKEV